MNDDSFVAHRSLLFTVAYGSTSSEIRTSSRGWIR
jgi:hypothetical protein